MILTCPECATGYFVEDGQIKPSGRTVRCAACGHRWTARPEAPIQFELEKIAPVPTEEPVEEPLADVAPLSADDLPRAFRDRAEEERRMRRAAILGIAWGGAAVAIALALTVAVIFRQSVVRAWPQTASAYAAVGLQVNPTGLEIDDVHADPSLQEGHATLVISGVIRNITSQEVVAPPLRISLLNQQGKRVAGQIAALGNGRVPAGAVRHFSTTIFDPPFSAANLQVDFAVGVVVPPVHAAPSQPPPPPNLDLRGPATADSSATNALPPPAPEAAPYNAAAAQ